MSLNFPTFPLMDRLTIEYKAAIHCATIAFPLYSDFHFTSLFSYDVYNDCQIAILHDNLVIRYRDYITQDRFYTVIGKTHLAATAHTLIKEARQSDHLPYLQLIPHETALFLLNNARFSIKEDRDNHDYIINLNNYLLLDGGENKSKRKALRRFQSEYPHANTLDVDINDYGVKQEIINIFDEWARTKGKDDNEIEHEKSALTRLLDHSQHFNLQTEFLKDKETAVGFAINEICQNRYAISHFMKTLPAYSNSFLFLDIAAVRRLFNKGVQFFNIEQDLGIEGLRQSKQSLNPSHFHKKYQVHLAQDIHPSA